MKKLEEFLDNLDKQKYIIPIGCECSIAGFLKKYGLRIRAFPFDWGVTYLGVANVIKDDFQNFIPDEGNFNTHYGILFPHDKFPDDKDKYIRRIEAFKRVLQTKDSDVMFFRHGHSHGHHVEYDERGIVKDDIKEAEELDRVLSIVAPDLKYVIIVVLLCEDCYDEDLIYESNNENVIIFNMIKYLEEDGKIEEIYKDIFHPLLKGFKKETIETKGKKNEKSTSIRRRRVHWFSSGNSSKKRRVLGKRG